MQLTATQIEAYNQNGFIILRGIIEEAVLERVSKALLRAIRLGVPKTTRVGDRNGQGDSYPAAARLFTVNGAIQNDPDLMSIAEHPTIVNGAEALLGSQAVLSAFVGYLKTPGAAGTSADYQGSSKEHNRSAAHCDYKTYQQAGSSLNWLFAITPLVDLDEQTGPLWVVPESHHVSRILPAEDGQRVRRVQRGSASQLGEKLDSKLRRGDLLFMNMFTWHEGGANCAGHDRMGIYNKYRALNSPPACGPSLFSNAARDTLSPQGRRLIPHCGAELQLARLIIEHEGRILFVRHNEQWKLPGGTIAREMQPAYPTKKIKMDMGNLIDPLERSVNEQLGLVIEWMTFISDFTEAGQPCRIYAHVLASSPKITPECVTPVQWFTPQQVEEQLITSGQVDKYVAEAIHGWHDDSILRGIGESGKWAKNRG